MHVGIKYESLWNFKRDRNGVRKTDQGFDATHRFSQVAEPRNLLGYAWLCIAEQFNQSPDLLYYPCEGFELCGQELPFKRGQNTQKDGRPARRMHCSDSCRQRTKRELKGLVAFRDRWDEYKLQKVNFHEHLDAYQQEIDRDYAEKVERLNNMTVEEAIHNIGGETAEETRDRGRYYDGDNE